MEKSRGRPAMTLHTSHLHNPDFTLLTDETTIDETVARLRSALETAGWLYPAKTAPYSN